MSKFKKGFTLIELLVVIAIIGILSSVVLASLNTARAKGADAAVKSAMASLRSQASLYYDSGQTFGTFAAATCPGSGGAGSVFASTTAIVLNINSNAGASSTCFASANGFSVVSVLKGGGYWCVDANNAVATASTTATAVACQ